MISANIDIDKVKEETTYNFIVNRLLEIILTYLNLIDLDIGKLVANRDKFESGFWILLASNKLSDVSIEIYEKRSGDLVSRFDIHLSTRKSSQQSNEDRQESKTSFEQIKERILSEKDELTLLPDDVDYRIVVGVTGDNDVAAPMPEIEGWTNTERMDSTNLNNTALGDSIVTGSVRTWYTFWPTQTMASQSDDQSLNRIVDSLIPTPHTFLQLPKGQTEAYFYYFTDETYTRKESKYRTLDNRLTLLGRHRTGLKVIVIDRDRISPEFWETVIDALEIGKYPTLLVSESSLGIEEASEDETNFQPYDGTYASLERGVIAEHILDDGDKLNSFLTELHDGARANDIRQAITKRKIIEMLAIGKEEVEKLINFRI